MTKLAIATPTTKDREQIEHFYEGVRQGIWLYAYWHDGEQMVGTCGKTLKEALAEAAHDEMEVLKRL